LNRIYIGNFKNDVFNGLGKVIFDKLKFEFEGIFNNGECPLKGTLKMFDDDFIYEGEIDKNFQKEG